MIEAFLVLRVWLDGFFADGCACQRSPKVHHIERRSDRRVPEFVCGAWRAH